MNANSNNRDPFPDGNPFSTRATRPGALIYRFPPSRGPEEVLAKLEGNQWWGEILGPHGSGKSTLIHALRSPLRERGRNVRRYSLTQGEKRLHIGGADLKVWDANTQVIVDGYEQLGGWSRSMLKRVCRQRGAGLLITTHTSLGFPTLFSTEVSLELAHQLVRELLRFADPLIEDDDVAGSFQRHAGNLREVFFDLYDLYESRRPQ